MISKTSAEMRLCLFINPTGHHQAAWRHPDADADAGINFDHYKRMVQMAEEAKFDAVFLADNLCVRAGPPEFIARVAQYVANFEPLTLLSALSAVTSRIGLIATASTSFNEPFHVARKFASLDHLSKGRAGWNIVTSGMEVEALNFNRDQHYEHDYRYEIAKEFVEVVFGLWDSWDDDAFIRDKANGIFSDKNKVHVLNHQGEHFKVRGPLNIPRPPQGRPLQVQAGSSPAGRAFAAQYAEMMFVTPQTIDAAIEVRSDMRKRAAALGRHPDHIKTMPGIAPVIGRTEAEAREKFEYLQSLLTDEVALHFLSGKTNGFDFSKYDLDGPVPVADIPRPTGANAQTGYNTIVALVERMKPTIRQLARHVSGSLAGMPFHGSATQLADLMEEWFRAGACDGFNVQPAYMPGAFDDFVDLVVPELRKRGLIRKDYEGTTLRDYFGLPRPPSRYESARQRELA